GVPHVVPRRTPQRRRATRIAAARQTAAVVGPLDGETAQALSTLDRHQPVKPKPAARMKRAATTRGAAGPGKPKPQVTPATATSSKQGAKSQTDAQKHKAPAGRTQAQTDPTVLHGPPPSGDSTGSTGSGSVGSGSGG